MVVAGFRSELNNSYSPESGAHPCFLHFDHWENHLARVTAHQSVEFASLQELPGRPSVCSLFCWIKTFWGYATLNTASLVKIIKSIPVKFARATYFISILLVPKFFPAGS